MLAQGGTSSARSKDLELWQSQMICECAHLPVQVFERSAERPRIFGARRLHLDRISELSDMQCGIRRPLMPPSHECEAFPMAGVRSVPPWSRDIGSRLDAVQSCSPTAA